MGPRVSISNGVHLGDGHARRFAREMLRDLNRYCIEADRATRALGPQGFANVKAQRRTHQRFVKALGRLLLLAIVNTGSRFRYSLSYVMWSVADPGMPTPRLGIEMLVLRCKGIMHEDESKTLHILSFSEHALQRLIQRAGVAEGDDYVPLLQAMTMGAVMLSFAARFNGGIPDGETWPLPVPLADGRTFWLLARGDTDNTRHPVVVTVYKGEWRNHPALVHLAEVCSHCNRFVDIRSDDDNPMVDVIAAFREAAKHI